MSNTSQVLNADDARQPYVEPAITHELALETRAGSPLRIDPMIDPLGLDPTSLK